MALSYQDSIERQAPWLPGEHFELALDARSGMATSPVAGENVLTVTTHRATKLGSDTGKRTTSVVPLKHVTAVEVIDAERPTERLAQGLVVLAIGVLLGMISWVVLSVELITLVVGGLPILVAIYILAGYVFPDTEGELVLHTGSFALRQPLHTPDARRDAYLVAHRIYDLMMTGEGRHADGTGGAPSREPARQADKPPYPEQGGSTEAPAQKTMGPAAAAEAGVPAGGYAGPQPSWPQPQRRPTEDSAIAREGQQEAQSTQPRWSSAWATAGTGSDAAESSVRAHFDQSPANDAAPFRGEPVQMPPRPQRHEEDMASDEAHRDEMAPAAEHAFEEERNEEGEASRREER